MKRLKVKGPTARRAVGEAKAVTGMQHGKSRSGRWSRVDVQVSVIVAAVVALSFLCVYAFNYQVTYRDMIETLKERSDSIYSYVEDSLDKSTFATIDQAADVDDPDDAAYGAYREMKEAFKRVKAATGVRYLYTAKRADDGTLIYVVDGLPSDSEDFRYPGDPIEPEIVDEMERALANEIVYPTDIKSTDWGHIFVSYYPIHADERVVGVIGIEFDAERQFEAFRTVRFGTPVIGALFCLVAVAVAVVLFRRISNPAYRDLANTDYLTKLKSRNAFEVDVENWNRAGTRVSGIVAIDLDGLKTVNDELGHAAGDELIRTAAEIVAGRCEDVGPVYRVGGDEFAVCCFELDEEGARNLACDLRAACADATVEGRPLSLSVGWALRGEGEDLRDVHRRADGRMYEEKARARTRRARTSDDEGERA